jgi:isovaleryl-CoA dehydrogenase
MYTKLSASRAYVYAVARACDAGNVSRQVSGKSLIYPHAGTDSVAQDCAGAILYSSDRAVEVAMEAQQCLVSSRSFKVRRCTEY